MNWNPWLPEEALADGATDRLLAEMLGRWSEKWFAHQVVRPLGTLSRTGAAEAPGGAAEARFLDDGLAVTFDSAATRTIAAMMLDAAEEKGTLTERDSQVVTRLAAAAVDDLCVRLSQMFRLPADARWRTGPVGAVPLDDVRSCALGIADREPLIHILVETRLMVGLVRCRIPPAPQPRPLQPISAGLGSQLLTVSALLGRCDLTLSELADLAIGDVLVLDRQLADPLSLVVDGQAKEASCTVEQEGEQLRLAILKPLGRSQGD